MEHVIIRHAPREEQQIALGWAQSTPDGDLLDVDIFEHDSTFLLGALQSGREYTREANSGPRMAFLPVQQPLMLENLIFRPGLTDRERAIAITRMTEFAIGEAYRRDVGELYFVCRHPETIAFAARHKFHNLKEVIPGVEVFRMNLRETFGV